MSEVMASTNDPAPADAKDALKRVGARCLTRRVWDWGKKWGESLIHLVWFWRAAVLLLLIVAGLFAWHEPDLQQRVAATSVLFVLGVLLALDLFIAILNLPLLLYYTSLWLVLTLTCLLDIVIYFRHLKEKQNRIAILVMMANCALIATVIGLWMALRTLGENNDSVQPAAVAVLATLAG